MHISALNWMAVEAYLRTDDRCILPLGCTEQHAYLSLATDSILAEKVAVDAAEPFGIPFSTLAGWEPDFGLKFYKCVRNTGSSSEHLTAYSNHS